MTAQLRHEDRDFNIVYLTHLGVASGMLVLQKGIPGEKNIFLMIETYLSTAASSMSVQYLEELPYDKSLIEQLAVS